MSTPEDKTNETEEQVEATETEPTAAAEDAATDAAATEDAAAEEAPADEKPKPARRSRARKKPAEEKAPEPEAKPAKPAREATEQRPVVRAQARYVRTSARKARLICDQLRGKDVHEARAILAYSPRAVARDWAKVLESAIANAEHNHELVGDDLRILTASADEGPTLKRFRPRAMGRATRIRKRTSHLTITLTPKE